MVVGVVRMSVLIEAVTAVVLAARFTLGYEEPPLCAVRLGGVPLRLGVPQRRLLSAYTLT